MRQFIVTQLELQKYGHLPYSRPRRKKKKRKARSGGPWIPVDDVAPILENVRAEIGVMSETDLRTIRRIRSRENKTCSFWVVDRLFTKIGIGHKLYDLSG